MTKIEIADDAGDEITEITTPIPFYIRVSLEDGTKRYRLRLIDDDGRIRGQYQGSIDRKYLEVHVPLIKLPKPGNLRILVEESSDHKDFEQQHQVSIHYLPYVQEIDQKVDPQVEEPVQEVDSEVDEKETTEPVQELNVSEEITDEETMELPLEAEQSESGKIDKKSNQTDEENTKAQTTELTKEDLEYLKQRKNIINDDIIELPELDESEEE